MMAVFRRELRALFKGCGLLLLALYAAGNALTLLFVNILTKSPMLANGVLYLALVMALFCGLLGMNAYPAERKGNTERLLYSLPVSTAAIFNAKLFSRLVFVVLAGVVSAVYSAALHVIAPSVPLIESLNAVLAVTVLGVLFECAAVCCSACSKHALTALALFAAMVALSYVMPIVSARVALMTGVDMAAFVMGLLIVLLLAYVLTNDVLISCIAAAAVEGPALYCLLMGNDAAVIGAVKAMMDSLSAFNGLTPFINGVLDAAVIIRWLLAAVLFAVFGLIAANARRHGKRRAL